ncbi:methyltransferase domain-containing protein [Pseudidiomarina woesei]|uniref:Ubiquinone/menaquinone biosynthesis C-methylase UbiE n=1 Tax=Pseudidiomarina woesei TaxID=1381080 RepID=A0A0K6GW65_9GAMM|nr:methyltransferase domain-containing protein [Pseudidiomarina woesei]CUA82854.1 Ubiquinone/menaquinone biosynthesis C-methylase UbiE [Pseudidiomarina woesei]
MPELHKLQIAQSFGKAARCYTQHNRLQQQCAATLLQGLPSSLGVVLDAGCGPAVNTQALCARAQAYYGFDLSAGMLAQAQEQFPQHKWLQGDLEQLPFAPESFDQIYVNLALQWTDNLTIVLKQLIHCLKPHGTLVFSTVLDGSMAPIGPMFQRVTGHRHHNQFLRTSELLTCLQQAIAEVGASRACLAKFQTEQIAIPYASMRDMLYDLKGIGANYQPAGRARLTREQLRRVETGLESYRENDGMLYLQWRIGFVTITKNIA